MIIGGFILEATRESNSRESLKASGLNSLPGSQSRKRLGYPESIYLYVSSALRYFYYNDRHYLDMY